MNIYLNNPERSWSLTLWCKVNGCRGGYREVGMGLSLVNAERM